MAAERWLARVNAIIEQPISTETAGNLTLRKEIQICIGYKVGSTHGRRSPGFKLVFHRLTINKQKQANKQNPHHPRLALFTRLKYKRQND